MFYHKESERIEGVDPVTYDSNVSVYVVKHKFPYIIGLQPIITFRHKKVSSIILAIKDIKETDQQLKEIQRRVTQLALDNENILALKTALRKTLVTEINGGF